MNHWYLLREDTPRDAAENMAVDLHLLQLQEAGLLDAPVLRTYAWAKPSLSLGYHQQWEPTTDLDALARHDVALVRRWTGGRAVLHDFKEITYSVTAATVEPFKARVTHNYRLIGEALERFTYLEHSPATMAQGGDDAAEVRGKRHLPCFASISDSEIEKSGRKLIGSSQKIGKGAFLQHGSIPVIHRLDVLQEITKTPQDMSGLMTSIDDHYTAAGLPTPDRDGLLDKLGAGFAEAFGITFKPLEQIPQAERIQQLIDDHFGRDDWTFRK